MTQPTHHRHTLLHHIYKPCHHASSLGVLAHKHHQLRGQGPHHAAPASFPPWPGFSSLPQSIPRPILQTHHIESNHQQTGVIICFFQAEPLRPPTLHFCHGTTPIALSNPPLPRDNACLVFQHSNNHMLISTRCKQMRKKTQQPQRWQFKSPTPSQFCARLHSTPR